MKLTIPKRRVINWFPVRVIIYTIVYITIVFLMLARTDPPHNNRDAVNMLLSIAFVVGASCFIVAYLLETLFFMLSEHNKRIKCRTYCETFTDVINYAMRQFDVLDSDDFRTVIHNSEDRRYTYRAYVTQISTGKVSGPYYFNHI